MKQEMLTMGRRLCRKYNFSQLLKDGKSRESGLRKIGGAPPVSERQMGPRTLKKVVNDKF